jgi:hypothetical protein
MRFRGEQEVEKSLRDFAEVTVPSVCFPAICKAKQANATQNLLQQSAIVE